MIAPLRLAAVAVAGARTLPRAAPLRLASPPFTQREAGLRLPRRNDIQGLRALAVLLVVAYHAGLPVHGGFVGVDVFFAISGFVIARMLLAELHTTGRIDFPRFYARRARRLLPAMALMVTVVGAAGVFVMPAASLRISALTGAAASVFGANVYLAGLQTGYFDASTTLDPFLHTWSLAVEEQFYVFFPLLLFVCWYFGKRMSAAAVSAVLVASLAGSFALLGGRLVADPEFASRLAFYASPTRAWEFAAGALVALFAPTAVRLSPSAGRILGSVGIAAVALAAVRTESNDLLAIGGSCILLVVGPRLLGVRPAVWIGDLSYSLYLWHWPLIVFARALWPGSGWAAPAAAAMSLLPAWASYRYVENPIRFSRMIRGRRLLVLAAACVAVPLAANVGLLAAQRAFDDTASMRSWERARALHADLLRGCDRASPAQQHSRGSCTWSVPAAKGDVVLLGDSNAGHFTEPVVKAANRAGYDATVTTYSSCPAVGLRVVRTGAEEEACVQFSAAALRRLLEIHPSLVVLAARTDGYLDDPAVHLGRPHAGLTSDRTRKAALWNDALRTVLSRLNRAGVPVLLVHPIPVLPPTPEQCAVIRILTQRCEVSVARAAAEARLSRSIALETAAAAAEPATSTIGFTDRLCSTDSCASEHDGITWYRDSRHLSVDGSLQLTDAFFRAIVAHAR